MSELFLILGLVALGIGYLGLSHRNGWRRFDWLDVHNLLDRPWLAGGRDRYYRQVGWLFTGLGLLMLWLEYRRGEL